MKRQFLFSFLFLLTVAIHAGDNPVSIGDWLVVSKEATITSDDGKVITISGEVRAEKEKTKITCEKIEFHLNDEGELKSFIATGKSVSVKRKGKTGKLQLAKSRKANFNAETGEITLTGGPPYLQDGDTYINTDSMDSKIHLHADGKYIVRSPRARPGGIIVPIGDLKKLRHLLAPEAQPTRPGESESTSPDRQ